MNKEEILEEYFLVETEKTEEIKGWKVIEKLEGCSSQSVSPLIELKTDSDSWLCDFKIKLLHCGLVLASPEYVIDEDDMIMEAIERIWKEWGVTATLQEALNQQIRRTLDETIITDPYYPHESWRTLQSPGTWTSTPDTSWHYTNTVTCSDATDSICPSYLSAADYSNLASTCSTSTIKDYITTCASTGTIANLC